MQIMMRYLRQTKGAYVYESVDLPSVIPVIVVRKEEVKWDTPPRRILMQFEPVVDDAV